MQLSEIKQRVSRIQQFVDEAARECRDDQETPAELKECVNDLDQQFKEAQQRVGQAQDEESLRECIDELEEAGDRAKQACEQADGVSEKAKRAVLQAHNELSRLKHQLH